MSRCAIFLLQISGECAAVQPAVKPRIAKGKSKSKRPDHHTPDGPLIIDGIPPAIMPAGVLPAPNPYGYDPLASVTPLGHKQLPSAYRRTADVRVYFMPDFGFGAIIPYSLVL